MKGVGTTSFGHRAAGLSLGLALGLAIGGFAGRAAAEPPPERPWDLDINLYGWITATDLHVKANWAPGQIPGANFTQRFDKDLGDAFSDWDGGGGGDIFFRYSRFVARFEGAWVQTDYNSNGWLTNYFAEGKIGVRVIDAKSPFWSGSTTTYDPNAPRVALDLMVGARYRNVESDVSANAPFGHIDRSDQRDWVDPLVGLHSSFGLLPHLTLEMNADIGGFDLGNASKLTWNLNPRLNYRAFDHFNIFVGYKHLQDNKDSRLDVGLSGPQAGLGFSF